MSTSILVPAICRCTLIGRDRAPNSSTLRWALPSLLASHDRSRLQQDKQGLVHSSYPLLSAATTLCLSPKPVSYLLPLPLLSGGGGHRSWQGETTVSMAHCGCPHHKTRVLFLTREASGPIVP